MSCLLTAGISKGCRDNRGGIKRVLIANKEMISGLTPTSDNDVTGITLISMNTNPLTSSAYTFFEFLPNKMSSNVVENVQSNLQNGTAGFEQVLTLLFAKNNATLRNQVKLMAQAELVAIVEDYNSTYWYYGEFNGLELNGGNSQTGTALSDMNGWTLTLSGYEPYPARIVTDSAIGTLGFTA